jgi:hypothetical protein
MLLYKYIYMYIINPSYSNINKPILIIKANSRIVLDVFKNMALIFRAWLARVVRVRNAET